MFFEEDAFDPAVKDYTIYISNEDTFNKNCQSYGAYKDYSANEYYKQAAETSPLIKWWMHHSSCVRVISTLM